MPTLTISNTEIGFDARERDRVVEIHTEDALRFYNNHVVENPSLLENLFGLYSFLELGRDLKARYARMKKPRHILTRRKSGCVWNPKGKVITEIDSFDTAPIEYNGEQCPDVWYESCLERLLGPGNAKRDISGTPEGAALLAQLISRIYSGMHDSIYNLLTFGNHPVITQSDTNNWYVASTGQDEWNDYKDQQLIPEVGGHITVLDSLATVDGLPQMNVSLPASEVQGSKFIGDVIGLFNRMVEAASSDFKVMIDSVRPEETPILLVTSGIFNAYRDYLIATYNGIINGYQLLVQGEDNIHRPIKGVLLWDGIPVVRTNAWSRFDTTVGVTTHRAVLTAPGNFGVAFDTAEVVNGQSTGVGMRITQRVLPPYQGKVYMDTTFRTGSSIIDPDFATMASLVLTP